MSDQNELFDHAVSTCREHVKAVGSNSTQWRVSSDQRVGGWAIESDSHGVVAVALQRDKHPMHGKEITWKEAEENACLIAAAPDLLEALKLCRFDSLNMTVEDLAFCRAAYTKAIGA